MAIKKSITKIKNNKKTKKIPKKKIILSRENEKDITISSDDYILAANYQCSMSAHQDPISNDWRFALEIFTDSNKLIDIHSQQTYHTYQDSLLDCYGIVEYLGYEITDKNKCANITINFWDANKKAYNEKIIYFDGYDFFNDKKN